MVERPTRIKKTAELKLHSMTLAKSTFLKVVACTFSGYHAVKFQFCGLFNSGGPLHHCKVIPPDVQHAVFKSFAETFSAEANELGLSTRCFSLELFIAFLRAWETPGPAAHVDVQR